MQAGSSPFQFGIDYRNKSPAIKQETPRSYNKFTPGVETVKAPVTPNTDIQQTPTTGNVSQGIDNRKASLNKYSSPTKNYKDLEHIKQKNESTNSNTETKKTPEFGMVFARKKFTPSRDILSQIQTNSNGTQGQAVTKTAASFNKYSTPVINNRRSDSGLNRSASMSAFDRNKTLSEPSISFNRPANRTLSDSSSISNNRLGGMKKFNGLNRTGSNMSGLKSVFEEVC